MSNDQLFDYRPNCPICGIEMKKVKKYGGAYATEWAEVTVSSSVTASANLYEDKSVYECPRCGKKLLA
jgi:ribosomal protein L37E